VRGIPFVTHFGSLQAAYAAVGYEPPAPFGINGKYWSKKAVLTGLQKLHAARGYTSTRLILSFRACLPKTASGVASAPYLKQ